MSEELKRKLFNYEVNPPESAWGKIAAALQEETYAEFPRKLYESEVNPPDNSWEKIAPALATDAEGEYVARLYNLEVAPPLNAWQNISGTLDEKNSLRTISPRKRIVPIIRFAVAASLVGIIAFGAFKLLNQKTADHGMAGKTVVPQSTSPNKIQPQNEQADSAKQSLPAPSNDLPKERTVFAKVNATTKKKFSTNPNGYMTQTPDLVSTVNIQAAANFQQASLQGEVPGNCPLIADADRYLNFMDPDGSLIRVSKKLADAVGCFYSRGNSDEYKQCQEQIKKWRDKISQSSSTPSADHFMDILDILKSVQDNQL